MSTIKIGTDELPLAEASAQWVQQQINNRRKDGESVCVVVRLSEPDLELVLATPTCGGSKGSGTPQFTSREKRVIELWQKRGLNEQDFNGGDVVAFLAHLKNL